MNKWKANLHEFLILPDVHLKDDRQIGVGTLYIFCVILEESWVVKHFNRHF